MFARVWRWLGDVFYARPPSNPELERALGDLNQEAQKLCSTSRVMHERVDILGSLVADMQRRYSEALHEQRERDHGNHDG